MSLSLLLQRMNVGICRQATILAQSRTRWVGSPVLATQRSCHNHDNLYQVVKRRSLEARAKQQTPKYPNNQPCVPSKNPPDIPPISQVPPKFRKNVSSTWKTSSTNDPCQTPRPPKSNDACENARVLNAGNRSSAPLCPPPPCPPPPCPPKGEASGKRGKGSEADRPCGPGGDGASDGAEGGSGGGMDDKTKMLLALLAALGAGGLLYWLLTRGSKDQNDDKEAGGKIPVAAGGGESTDNKSCVGGGGAPMQPVPAKPSDLPKHVPYLLIGGGTAAFSAFRAIKSNDATAKVLMITNEYRKPYMRPPLSKELWYSAKNGEIPEDYRFKQWTGSERSLFFEPEEFFVDPTKLMDTANGGIAVAQGYTVKKIDPQKRIAYLKDGTEIGYDECLIATGCSPKNLTVFTSAPLSVKEKVMVYRNPEDFERLKAYADAKRSITIVGNGFMGSELACSLAGYAKEKGTKIYQIFPESGNMSKVLPAYLSQWTTQKVQAAGVCVLPRASVRSVQRDESVVKLNLNNGDTILTDIVVVCVGCDPNTNIATLSGLEVDRGLGGFLVNAELEARRNLYVAGDASCFYDPLLGRRRVEHHDHSVVSGRLAGENMVGKKKPYSYQSMFWSDLGPEIGFEAIGLVDAALPTVGVFAIQKDAVNRESDNLTEVRVETTPDDGEKSGSASPEVKCDDADTDNYGKGVIFYLKDEKIVGVLLWNLFGRIGLARTLINQNKKYSDLHEVAKLFEIYA